VILQLLGSLAVLALTAAPGRAYERRADERAPRHSDRSTFAEYVELVITGATTTFFAVLVVLLVAGAIDFIGPELLDLGRLFGEPGDYAADEPWRCVACGFAAAVLSFVIADLAARRLHPKPEGEGANSYKPHTIWWESFSECLPEKQSVAISAELSSGLQVVGILRGFTPTESDDRELRLQPVVWKRPGGQATKLPEDQFMILRESQVNFLVSRYVPEVKEGP